MQLQDNRRYQAMTVQDADQLFLNIARHRAMIEKETAAHKKRIAELELTYRTKVDQLVQEDKDLTDELTAYILANPDRFVKPRKHQVEGIGTYGITTDKAYIDVQDKQRAIQFALDNGHEILKVAYSLDKDAAQKWIIRSGQQIPGVTLIPAGDVAKLSFSKGFADKLED